MRGESASFIGSRWFEDAEPVVPVVRSLTTEGGLSHTAKTLGITREGLHKKLRQYGI